MDEVVPRHQTVKPFLTGRKVYLIAHYEVVGGDEFSRWDGETFSQLTRPCLSVLRDWRVSLLADYGLA